MFFKGIYDKTSTYFSNLINKIYSELSHLLTKLDKHITVIQKEQVEEAQRRKEQQEQKQREQIREQEKKVASNDSEKMGGLKLLTQNLVNSKGSLIERIKQAMKNLEAVEN